MPIKGAVHDVPGYAIYNDGKGGWFWRHRSYGESEIFTSILELVRSLNIGPHGESVVVHPDPVPVPAPAKKKAAAKKKS